MRIPGALAAGVVLAAVAAGSAYASAVRSRPAPRGLGEGESLFRNRVLSVLRENCFDCHGPAEARPAGGLRMDGRDALLAGGESGPAVVPGDLKTSLLAVAIGYRDPYLQMPPDGELGPEDRAAIERWIELGAPWPDEVDLEQEHTDGPEAPGIEEGRSWWSFRPLVRPPVPDVAHPDLVASPIDAFLLARLEERGIAPNDPAPRRELARRVHLGLTGLPPTFEELEAFLKDERPDAYARLVDRLLDSRAYAEHWGRHWLDLVRFAQTNGYERDTEKPFAWRYRDWVIQAFDRDLPYDRFLTLQLAGDELEDGGVDGLIATGFYRLGLWDDEPDDAKAAAYEELDDVVRTIGEGMLGVTLACARCHDHKFDPFPQEDYYSVLAYVANVRPYEVPAFRRDVAVLLAVGDTPEAEAERETLEREERARVEAELKVLVGVGKERSEARGGADAAPPAEMLEGPERERALALLRRQGELQEFGIQGDADWVLCVREQGAEPPPTHVLVRGDAGAPGKEVPPRPPRVLLGDAPPPAAEPPADGRSSGRRLALAHWIASAENPLTARAIVNRVWQFHMGRGLAPTVNDLGFAGAPPTHPELCDWLASVFVEEDGWSLKALHRRILLSNAYRLSSRATDPERVARDEANELFWRQTPRRLAAEEVHDALLLAAGELVLEEGPGGGRGFFPALSREVFAGSSRPGLGWELSTPEERARRAVYAFVKRTLPVPLFESFDAPGTTLPTGTRGETTTATQALALLNGAFANARAAALAERVAREAGEDDRARVARAFERVLARRPTAEEEALCVAYLERETRSLGEVEAPLVVRPDVPPRLDAGFLPELAAEDFLLGPRVGWRALRGAFGEPYNGTLEAHPLRGPALLLEEPLVADLCVEARVRVLPGAALGLLLRAEETGSGVPTGFEVRLDREAQSLAVLAQGPQKTFVLFGPVPFDPAREELSLALRLVGNELSITVDGEEQGPAALPPMRRAGAFGLRALGEGAEIHDLTLSDAEGAVLARLGPDDPGPSRQRALEALCLVLLNLDEFLYVD